MHTKKFLVGVVSAMVMSGMMAQVSNAAATIFTLGAQGSSNGAAGQANSYAVSVADNGSSVSNAIVDVEVHDASGAKVFQQFFANQNFGAGQTQSYNVSWTPGAVGSYSMDVGVFNANWSGLLQWDEGALSIQATGNSPAPQFSSAAILPSSATVSQAAAVGVSVTNSAGSALTNAIVDVEVHDASGAKVFQQFFANQNFGAGQTQSYNVSWTPGAVGSYSMDVGVFNGDWSKQYYWANNQGTLSVNPAAPAAPAATSFSVAANGTPSLVTAGQSVAIGENLTDTGTPLTNAIVDVEVHDASGAKVFQQFFANQNFGAGQTQSYNVSWTPGAAAGDGTYSVNVGVFSNNWSDLLFWKDTSQMNLVSAANIANTVSTSAAANVSSLMLSPSPSSKFYVDPNSPALAQAASWKSSDPADASLMTLIGSQPQATWFGDWNANVTADVNTVVTAAQSAGQIPVLVAYNIPDRDCGGFSAGGAQTASAYQAWIQQFAAGIGSRPAWVVLEPDALASMDCLSSADQTTRLSLLSYAVQTLKSLGNTHVYLDAGNSNWVSASTMATRLQQADIAQADGFSLNVSNFFSTASNTQYGTTLSALVGGKHFVIDTSRNGAGSNGQWCNPSGMALGALPTTNTGNSLVDAYLWIKVPGESDGTCNGGPSAGTWWPQYAVGLANVAGY